MALIISYGLGCDQRIMTALSQKLQEAKKANDVAAQAELSGKIGQLRECQQSKRVVLSDENEAGLRKILGDDVSNRLDIAGQFTITLATAEIQKAE